MTTSGDGARALRLLVTGGCGYLGSCLVRTVVADPALDGVTVRIVDSLSGGRYTSLMDLPDGARYEFLEADILDPSSVRRALHGVDAVVHLAAVVRTPISFDSPDLVEQVNHWGTSHLIEACLEAGVRRFIFASTAAVYGPGGSYREDQRGRPLGFYAESKWNAEESVRVAVERGLEPTVLRFGTLFGDAPGVRFDTVANRFAYLAGVGRPLTVYGSGEQRRPLIHVEDAARAVMFCLRSPERTAGRVFNVISGNASVLDVAEAVSAARPGTELRYTEQDVLTHLSYEVNGGAFIDAGWQPRRRLEEGLAELSGRFRGLATVPLPTRGPLDEDDLGMD